MATENENPVPSHDGVQTTPIASPNVTQNVQGQDAVPVRDESQTGETARADGAQGQDATRTSNDEVVGDSNGPGSQIVDSILAKVTDSGSDTAPTIVPIAIEEDFVWPDEKSVFNPLCSNGVPEVPESGDSTYKSIFTEI